MKKKKDFWVELAVQFGIASNILAGKITETEMKEIIKTISQISTQKMESRLVINLPEWLKKLLAEKAKADNMSMNQVIRIALLDYLTKEE